MSLGQIRPIIKKNLIIIKRNIAKSILQLFYPTIILLFFIYVFQYEENKLIPEQNHLNYQKDYSLDVLLNKPDYNTYAIFALIGDNKTDSEINLNQMENFIRINCKLIFSIFYLNHFI